MDVIIHHVSASDSSVFSYLINMEHAKVPVARFSSSPRRSNAWGNDQRNGRQVVPVRVRKVRHPLRINE